VPAGQKAIAAVILGLPHPPSPLRPAACSGYFPVAISIHASQVTQCNHDLVRTAVINPITAKNTFVDVNANKSLNGNERETPSTRPPGGRERRLPGGAGWRLPGGGPPSGLVPTGLWSAACGNPLITTSVPGTEHREQTSHQGRIAQSGASAGPGAVREKEGTHGC
jgi:hypothetical protein